MKALDFNSGVFFLLIAAMIGIVIVGGGIFVVDSMVDKDRRRITDLEASVLSLKENMADRRDEIEAIGNRLNSVRGQLGTLGQARLAGGRDGLPDRRPREETAGAAFASRVGGEGSQGAIGEGDVEDGSGTGDGCRSPLLMKAGKPEYAASLTLDTPLLEEQSGLLSSLLKRCRSAMKDSEVESTEKTIERIEELLDEIPIGSANPG